MTLTAIVVLTVAVVLAAWAAVLYWQRRADARRIDRARAMSGDTDILVPDYESTLAISIGAPAARVWEGLLGFGWPRRGRRGYEWLGRAFGFLEPAAGPEDTAPAPTTTLPVGRRSRINVRSIDPGRALVLGRDTGRRQWTWQFEISVLDERRTRLILRDRARGTGTVSGGLLLAVARAFSFVLTRKMLLDIKTAAETTAGAGETSTARVA